jgi:transposase
VRETLRPAEVAGLSWSLDDTITDEVLETLLYKAAGTKTGHRRAAEPDWAEVADALDRRQAQIPEIIDVSRAAGCRLPFLLKSQQSESFACP